MTTALDTLAVNTIRLMAAEGVQKANSGHPGMPMGCAPIAYALYAKHMTYNPANPAWMNRDRFVLSAGHGSMLLYSCLHLSGFALPMEQIQQFRQWGSITPGHPEFGLTPGVETTTGPLGQGFANAVGMAIAQEYLASQFNRTGYPLIDHFIYGICSDGDLEEGVSHEAASLAGHLKLGKMVFFYDDNGISIDGETHLSFSDNTALRFEAYGWHVTHVSDVNDLAQIEAALTQARKDPRPSLIITKTHIGYGSPNKQDKEAAHGSPLGNDEIALTKKNLDWPFAAPFTIPDEVQAIFNARKQQLAAAEAEWNNMFRAYSSEYPAEAKLLQNVINGEYGSEWKNHLPVFQPDAKGMATRQASGKVLNAIAPYLPTLIGGSADLAPSNNTYLSAYPAFSAGNRAGRNFHFGIREHGMASALNGMAYYGGVIPYGGTFMVFSDYLRPTLRLAGLSHIRPIIVLTHDSIGLGEDGPTHQPVEHLAALRSIPGALVIRPSDANETAHAWRVAVEYKAGPVLLVLSRQNMPVLDRSIYAPAGNLEKGAYILQDCQGTPQVILMGTGSETALALQAAEKLAGGGVKARVVSFPSWELFERQSPEYKESVLPAAVTARVAVEAGVSLGWHKYVGLHGACVSLDRYGASAPWPAIMENFGFTADNVAAVAKSLL